MTISSIKAWRYSIPVPAYSLGDTTLIRSGFFIAIQSDTGIGFGEVAPLPGMSPDTLADCESQFYNCIDKLYAYTVPETLADLWALLDDLKPPIALQHGLEMAFMQLMAGDISVASFLNPDSHKILHQHGLLYGDIPTVLEKYRKLASEKYQHFKLKVGHLSEKEAVKLVTAVFNAFNPEHTLCLDANRQWPLDTAIAFCHSIDHIPISYIEEPIELSRELGRFYAYTGMRVGLDETLIQYPQTPVTIDYPYIAIIKPMCIGLRRLYSLYCTPSKYRQGITLSACYESVVSHYYYCQLAAALSHQSIGLGAPLTQHDLYQAPVITLSELPTVTQYHIGLSELDATKIGTPWKVTRWDL